MTRLGYARVSTSDQDTEMQIRELEAAGCERIYRDQGVSGTKTSRPELDKMLERLSQVDEVVVWKLDRLGRNTRHLLELLDDFKARNIKFRSLRDGIATDPGSDLGAVRSPPPTPTSNEPMYSKNKASNPLTLARSSGQAVPPSTATSPWNLDKSGIHTDRRYVCQDRASWGSY